MQIWRITSSSMEPHEMILLRKFIYSYTPLWGMLECEEFWFCRDCCCCCGWAWTLFHSRWKWEKSTYAFIRPFSSRSFPPPEFCLTNMSELVVVLESMDDRGPFRRNSTPSSSLILPDLVLSVPSVMEDPCPKSEDVIVFDS